MKKFLALLLVISLLALSFAGCNNFEKTPDNDETTVDTIIEQLPRTEPSPASDFQYYEDNIGGIVIVKYEGTDEHVFIPSTINNLPVTTIQPGAFRGAESVKSVVISKNITVIEEGAFFTCTNLVSFFVEGDNEYYSSQNGVLYNKDKSKIVSFPLSKQDSYIIPNSVKSIERFAFFNCTGITNINIPFGIEMIDSRAFNNCPNLVNINVDADNKFYSSLNGALYNKNQSMLIAVPGGKTNTFEIPDSVNNIGPYAFYGCEKITNIIIPDSVTDMGTFAFSRCSIKNITLPDGIKKIEGSLFCSCTSLKSIVIPDSVTEIASMAFFQCTSLTDVHLPSGLICMEDRVFSRCTALTDIVIPENVETIGAVLFQNCNHVNIYVKKESQPEGWDSTWNYLNFPVVWGYTGS